ncbi:hypothetical protein TELCIR_08439 [Teladorsagia circumcincta]|uniref:NOTCH1 EGF-like calcium-binding domain-containing protein n=1 Tax=Teladorsagia circumcincta TaxID=45464 RepID=A0A2G9UHS0_TELCI|nr:hypothetical protein TELCIR_08439 [Teladorsagia circumcincta]
MPSTLVIDALIQNANTFATIDRNECLSSNPPCEKAREICINTIGSYLCRRRRRTLPLDQTEHPRFVRRRDGNRRVASENEQSSFSQSYLEAALKKIELICPPGWQPKDDKCVEYPMHYVEYQNGDTAVESGATPRAGYR